MRGALLHLESGHRLFIVSAQDSTVTNRFPAKPGQLKHIMIQAKTGNFQHLRDMPIGNPLVADSSPEPRHLLRPPLAILGRSAQIKLTHYPFAASSTTGIVAAGRDEVSAAIARLFGSYGQDFQALSAAHLTISSPVCAGVSCG